MSNKSVTKKEKIRREKTRIEERKKLKQQKKFIEGLKKEIDTLEDEINHVKVTNVKRAVIKNIRIAGRKVLKWVPACAAGIIIAIPYTEYIGKPFQRQPISTSARVEQKYDSFGHFHEKRQLIDFDSTSNYLDLYSKWEQDGNNYKREIKRYFISDETVKKCLEVINGDLITNFDTMFGIPNYIVTEKDSNLTEEEINQGEYIEIVHHFTDEEDRGIRMTNFNEELGISFFYICSIIAANFTGAMVTKKFRINCEGKIKKYKIDYKPVDKTELQKELKLKKDNYRSLVGE